MELTIIVMVLVFVPLLIAAGYAIGLQHGKEDGILWNRKILKRRAQIPESHSREVFWRRYINKPPASVERGTAAMKKERA